MESMKRLPRMPENTCPSIDDVKSEIEKVELKINDLYSSLDFSSIRRELETIRASNSDLRQLAEHYEGEATRLEKENHALEEKNEQLERDNHYLEQQGVILEARVSALESPK